MKFIPLVCALLFATPGRADVNQCQVDFAFRARSAFLSPQAAQQLCDKINAALGAQACVVRQVDEALVFAARTEAQGRNLNSTFQAAIAAVLKLLQDALPGAERLNFKFPNLNRGTC